MKKSLDNILNQTFKFAKKIAKDFYFEWSKTPPSCPAFNGELINISHHGWEHLIHLRKRTKFELLGRLFVLERTKELLESAHNFQDHLKKDDVEFWNFEAEVEKVKIKIIIRSIKGGSKHFYSVIRKGSVEKEIG